MPATEFPPLVLVDLKQSKTRWPGRAQKWYWVALNGNNFHRLARSSENYTNQRDCIDAIWELFGGGTNVYFRHAEQGNQVLRMAAGTG